jgi:DNA-binding GntR family transcriptional regulator
MLKLFGSDSGHPAPLGRIRRAGSVTTVGSTVRSGTVPPETVTEFVTEQIRDRIVLGSLQPGQKLSVYDLAAEFGVSRVPLREAVRQLEAESLVDNLPRRGTLVRPLTVEDVSDAFEILDKIEVIAARRAAMSSDGSTAREMRHWLDQMQALSDRGVPPISEEMLHAHRAFHFALFESSGEGVLQRHLCMLWNTCERYVINSRTEERQASAAAEHSLIVEKIEARDPNGTAEALKKHIDAALAGTMTYLENRGISRVTSV